MGAAEYEILVETLEEIPRIESRIKREKNHLSQIQQMGEEYREKLDAMNERLPALINQVENEKIQHDALGSKIANYEEEIKELRREIEEWKLESKLMSGEVSSIVEKREKLVTQIALGGGICAVLLTLLFGYMGFVLGVFSWPILAVLSKGYRNKISEELRLAEKGIKVSDRELKSLERRINKRQGRINTHLHFSLSTDDVEELLNRIKSTEKTINKHEKKETELISEIKRLEELLQTNQKSIEHLIPYSYLLSNSE